MQETHETQRHCELAVYYVSSYCVSKRAFMLDRNDAVLLQTCIRTIFKPNRDVLYVNNHSSPSNYLIIKINCTGDLVGAEGAQQVSNRAQ